MLRILITVLALIPSLALAGPESYRLDAGGSSVNFSYVFDGAQKSGKMPVKSADLLIDLDNVPASRVLVTLNAGAARAGFIFATEAMKSRSVLDTDRFPEIHFRSTRIRGDLREAAVTGDLTIRGVTRPVTLTARLFRQRGTDLRDRNNLLIELNGTVRRSEFGANGFPKLVGDEIGLRIIAQISK
ncbi:YceI family protein [uncultured Roseovarius sp.]|uniref:YceI family protein n=1 Tax=uncultured Roseovarius sp. TaxID=293344 RepID=UPI002627E762|nr:YceI family protein [uncultured Roseovarius sp.]